MRRGISQVSRLNLCKVKPAAITRPDIHVRFSGRQMLAVDRALALVTSVAKSRDIKNKIEHHHHRFCSEIVKTPLLVVNDHVTVKPGTVEIPMTSIQVITIHRCCVDAFDKKLILGKDIETAIYILFNAKVVVEAKKARNRQISHPGP